MGIEIAIAIASALAGAYGAHQSASAAEQRRQYELSRRNASPFIGQTYEDPILKKRREADDAKCPCCGSRQFVDHHAARICAYCRSEQ